MTCPAGYLCVCRFNSCRKQKLDMRTAISLRTPSADYFQFIGRRMPWGVALCHQFSVCRECGHARVYRIERREIEQLRLSYCHPVRTWLKFHLPYADAEDAMFDELAAAVEALLDSRSARRPVAQLF